MKNSLSARAKVNLHLSVGPRRRDGFHSLKTLFQEISLHDTLSFQLAPKALTLRVRGRSLSAGPDNIVLKALHLLRAEMKVTKGMSVVLEKNIPMGAGLGGGSSDAAAALWGAYVLWKGLPFSRAQKRKSPPAILKKCAARLGADVSFFLTGGRAWGRGKGEKLTTVKKYPKQWMVLVYPRVHVATAKAYAWLDQDRQHTPSPSRERAGVRANSFESVVFIRFPAVKAAHAALQQAGCSNVLMSGSGASVFGFVSGKSMGRRVVKQLPRNWDRYLARMN